MNEKESRFGALEVVYQDFLAAKEYGISDAIFMAIRALERNDEICADGWIDSAIDACAARGIERPIALFEESVA